jgi:hypothetical protein
MHLNSICYRSAEACLSCFFVKGLCFLEICKVARAVSIVALEIASSSGVFDELRCWRQCTCILRTLARKHASHASFCVQGPWYGIACRKH